MRIFRLMTFVAAALLTVGCTQPEPVHAEYEPADCECEAEEAESVEAQASGEVDEEGDPRDDARVIAEATKVDGAEEVAEDEPTEEVEAASEESDGSEQAEAGEVDEAAQPVGGVGVVNLNEASASELMALPGVGPALAERIVAFRNKRSFDEPEHLKRVRGIGEATFEDLAPMIAVE